jgi:hypothetical protein
MGDRMLGVAYDRLAKALNFVHGVETGKDDEEERREAGSEVQKAKNLFIIGDRGAVKTRESDGARGPRAWAWGADEIQANRSTPFVLVVRLWWIPCQI